MHYEFFYIFALTKLLNNIVNKIMSEEKQNITKEQLILQVAEQEFLTKGFDGARTTTIAKKAGVTHAMLHYYFRTKELLFERIINDKMKILSQSMIVVLGNPELPIVDRIRDGVASHFDFVYKNPLLPHLLINEIISNKDRYEIYFNKYKSVLNDIISKLQTDIDNAAKNNEIQHIDVRDLFMSIFSLNIFSFVAFPVFNYLIEESDYEKYVEARKKENIETIMRRIKKI